MTRILFLGASIVSGFGLEPGEGLVDHIARLAQADGVRVEVHREAAPGAPASGGEAQWRRHLSHHGPPDVVVVALGLGDVFYGRTVRQVEEALTALVRRIHQDAPEARVFLIRQQLFQAAYLDADAPVAAWPLLFDRVARAEEATLLPFFLEGVAGVPSLNQRDGVHPNAAGALRVAQNVWRSINIRSAGEEVRLLGLQPDR